MFLDDCHLSDEGHRALAEVLATELRRLGWAP
jgi:lysophospholipase L1-like esterase